MIDMLKEIIFKDGITFSDSSERYTLPPAFWDKVDRMVKLGNDLGLSLDKYEVNDEMIYFEWRGPKRGVLKYYNYYSKHMCTESLESRKRTQKIILGK